MRLNFYFDLKYPFIDKDYRRGFASIIKEAISRANKNLFEFYYKGKFKLKPFTFNVYFPDGVKFKDDRFEVGNKVVLKVSTNNIDFATSIFNGMLDLRFKAYPLFDNQLILQTMNISPPIKIKNDEIRFRTLGPMLITNKGCHIEVNGKEYDMYLIPDDPGFDEGLRFLVKEQVRKFLNVKSDFFFDYKIINNAYRVIPVWHYNQWNKSIKAEIIIKSHPSILQLLYDIGIGARRSQGFGMLEVIK